MAIIDDKGIGSLLGKVEETAISGTQSIDKLGQVERIVKMVVEGLKIVAPKLLEARQQSQNNQPIQNSQTQTISPINQNKEVMMVQDKIKKEKVKELLEQGIANIDKLPPEFKDSTLKQLVEKYKDSEIQKEILLNIVMNLLEKCY